jgi:GTP cyclohydrolase III
MLAIHPCCLRKYVANIPHAWPLRHDTIVRALYQNINRHWSLKSCCQINGLQQFIGHPNLIGRSFVTIPLAHCRHFTLNIASGIGLNRAAHPARTLNASGLAEMRE